MGQGRAVAQREAVVVVNAHSRHGERAAAMLYEGLRARGFTIAAFHPAKKGSEAAKLVKRAAKAGAPTIVLAGGDGTMTKAVDALAHRESVLGVIPAGTGNSFALSLGIANDLEAALDVVAGGRVATIDLGVVDGRHFANFATIGLASRIAGRTKHGWKQLFGVGAYVAAALRPLLRQPRFRAQIAWEGGKLALVTEDVIVANGRYFGTTPVAPEATLAEGKLTLFIARERSALAAVTTYAALAADVHTRLPNAHVVEATAFDVRTAPRQLLGVDGAVIGRTPARFSLAPRALRVYVPASGLPE